MQIYVINLERHAERWRRMSGLLQGLNFTRIAAVDGKTVEGTEWRDPFLPMSYEALSRYERACMLSHRLAMEEFLAGPDPYCCIFEDDIYISPDFPRFINDESWIPRGCGIAKIESNCQPGFYIGLSRRTVKCLDRTAVMPRSLNFGCAAYIISRQGAEIFLQETFRPDRTIDRIMFDEAGLRKFHPVYQLMPALCIQANQMKDGIVFPELATSVQPTFAPQVPPPVVPQRKTWASKIKREFVRPFYQLNRAIQPARRALRNRINGVCYRNVPYA